MRLIAFTPAMHGYLRALCDEIDVQLDGHPTMNQLFKALRRSHPALAEVGARGEDVNRILGSMATILDALNPVRNRASVAHPNDQLIGEPGPPRRQRRKDAVELSRGQTSSLLSRGFLDRASTSARTPSS